MQNDWIVMDMLVATVENVVIGSGSKVAVVFVALVLLKVAGNDVVKTVVMAMVMFITVLFAMVFIIVYVCVKED